MELIGNKMISIIMPTYNCAQYIRTAIRSILNQSFTDFELLIIDDGSEDDTKTIVQSVRDNRIKYLSKSHTGFADSIEYGFKKASCELIARMDADDVAHPKRVEKHYNYLSQHNNVDIISNWYAVFSDKKIKYIVNRSITHDQIVKNLSIYSDLCHPSLLMKKNTFQLVNGFNLPKEYDAFADYILWLRLKNKVKFYNIPEVLHFYRERKNSLMSEALSTQRKLIYKIQEPYYQHKLYNEFGLSDTEEIIARGWREYLYGDKSKSFYLWRKLRMRYFTNYKIIAAELLRLLPDYQMKKFYGKRIQNRIDYFMNYFNHIEKQARADFANLFLILNQNAN